MPDTPQIPPNLSTLTETEEWDDAQDVAKERRVALLDLPNVHTAAIGAREVGGEFRAEAVIVVYVETKVPADELDEDEKVPREIDGVRTDVQEVEQFEAHSTEDEPDGGYLRREIADTYMAGYSVGHASVVAGSAGALMRDPDGDPVLISNRHIASDSMANTVGDPFQQPGRGDADRRGVEANALGTIKELGPWTASGTNYTDSALIEVQPEDVDAHVTSRMFGAGHLKQWEDPSVGDQNVNFGRTTGITSGTVMATDGVSNINYGWGTLYYENTVIFSNFTSGGDSGSITGRVDPETGDVYPTALNFAGSLERTIGIPASAVINAHGPFTPVVEDLDDGDVPFEPPYAEEWPFFEVAPLDNRTTNRGQYNVLVTNAGGWAEEQTITFSVNGTVHTTVDLELEPTEWEILSFDISNVSNDGFQDFRVTSEDDEVEISTAIQTITEREIEAKATDREGNPVSGVTVTVSDGSTTVDTVETGPDGTARTYHESGSYTLTYSHPQYNDATDSVSVTTSNENSAVILQPVDYATGSDHFIRLRVQGARRRAVEDATVTIKNSGGETVQTHTTDDEGYILAWLNPSGGPYGLTISKNGYDSKAVLYEPTVEGAAYHTQTRIKPSEEYHFLRVGVRNSAGHPAEGVRVGVHRGGEIPIYSDVSDRTGLAELVVKSGSYVLSLEGEGYAQTWIHSQPGDVTADTTVSPVVPSKRSEWFNLVRRVRNRQTGQPIHGAEITVNDGSETRTTRSAIDGYGYFWLPTDTYTVNIDAGSAYEPITQSVTLTSDTAQTAAVTPVGANEYTLSTVVRDRFGDPIEGATVTVEGNGPVDSGTGTTASNGAISFADLIEGSYSITANAPDYNPNTRTVSLDSDGQETVLVLYPEDGAVSTGTTNADGEVTVSLRPGDYVAYGERENFTDSSIMFNVVENEPSTHHLTLQREEGALPEYSPTYRRVTWSRRNEWLGGSVDERNGMIAREDPGHRADKHTLRLGSETLIGTGQQAAYWPLDETSGDTIADVVGDSEGNVYGATLGTEAVLGGTAVRFDGVSDYIMVPTISGDLTFPGRFSIHALVKKQSSHGNQTILRNGFDEPGVVFLELCDDGRISFGFYDSGGGARYSDQFHAGNAVAGEWHHIIASYRSGADELVVYLNGQRETLTVTASRPAPPIGEGNENNIGIGRRISGADRPFDGYIGQLGFHEGGISLAPARRAYAMLSGASVILPPRTT